MASDKVKVAARYAGVVALRATGASRIASLDALVDLGRGLQLQMVGLEGHPVVRRWDGQRVARVLVAAECAVQRHEAVTDQPRLHRFVGRACNRPDSIGLELSVKDKQTVNVPVWAGAGDIVIGGALLVFGSRRG